METPPKSKRAHLRQLVAGKNMWSEPLSSEDQAKGFRGWHERGSLPHCDKPGLIQFITFRLWDSMPASRKGEIETRGAMLRAPARLRPSLSDARQNFRDDLPLRLRTLRGAVVEAHAHCAGPASRDRDRR